MIDHDCACYDCNVQDSAQRSYVFTLAVLVLLGFALTLCLAGAP